MVDPVFDLSFPKPDATGYYGLLELRRGPNILLRRLVELCAVTPRSHPVHRYPRRRAGYDQASSINWNKNALTRFTPAMLRKLGNAVYRLPRPRLLEEPVMIIVQEPELRLRADLLGEVRDIVWHLDDLVHRPNWTRDTPEPQVAAGELC